jgi:hypothetical protein
MPSSQRKAGLTGMIRGDLKSGEILVWLAWVNCRTDVYDLVVQYCIDAMMQHHPTCILHDNTILFDRQGVHGLNISFSL